jgi:inositol transport system substrate-binding protein
MEKEMNKKLTLIMALFLIAAMLIGCTPAAEEAAPAEEVAPVEEEAPAEEVAPVEEEPEEEMAEESQLVFGFVSANFNDTGQVFIKDGAKAKAEELGVTFREADAQEDVIKQQDLVQAFITEQVDVLIVVPVSTDAMDPIIAAGKDAGIPVVFVNRNPFGENQPPEGTYYVGSEEVVAGQQQAMYLGELMGDEGGKVFVLQGKLDNEAAIKRTSGFVDTIEADFPNIEIVDIQVGNWQRDQGVSITENWLTAYGDEIDAVVANNDEMALGAVEVLQRAGRDDVIVLGVDFTPDAKAAIEDGTMVGSVRQDLAGQGAGGVQIAYDLFNAEVTENPLWIPFVLITADDVDQY